MRTDILKKIGIFGMTAMMVFSFAACGGSGENLGGETPGGNENPGGENPGGNEPELFTGYDESLRVDDERDLTPQEYAVYNITGTDDFGRTILTADGKEDEDRYVGLFYFLWLGQNNGSRQRGVYDISEITKDGTDLEAFQVDDDTSPLDAWHFWGQPVWGYYNSTDEWVIRKQVEMFCMAGVDFLIFDATNGYTYQAVTDVLFKVLLEYQAAGWKVPKIMYYAAGTREGYMGELKTIYNYCYKTDKYRSLWFAPDGKPIITMYNNFYYAKNYGLDLDDPTEKAMYDLFEFRCRQWPNEAYEDDGIPWIEFVPDGVFDRQPSHNGWINVSVAQHRTVRFSDTTGTQGRGYSLDVDLTDHTRFAEDLNYQSQWKTVLDYKDEARFTFVTGWNEWVATKFLDQNGVYYTVDTFDAEFSRDLEPSENLGDNGYILTAKYIRENNYTAAKHYKYPVTTIDIAKDDPLWSTVKKYADFTGDCLDRDCVNFAGKERITDASGRNDISSVQVARDNEYLYFRVETAADITPYEAGDTGWMNLWIKTRNAKETYLGYDYVIGRKVAGGKTSVSHAVSGGKLEETGEGDLYVSGNVMIVRVELGDLGLGGANYDIEFKVTDNVQIKETGTYPYLDFYRTGDSAPIGRLNYRYGY